MQRKFKDLRFKDNFMFAAAMQDAENCRLVLERVLEMEIDHVEPLVEHSIVYSPEFHGVRLDVYAKGGDGTHFNVEMQVEKEEIFKRSRYYHSSMDMNALDKGASYDKLPDSFVIFICDYDPFDKGFFKYTRNMGIREYPGFEYDDGTYTIFLNTKGTNEHEVSKELVEFLKYAGSDDGTFASDDYLVEKLNETVSSIKRDRSMEARFMTFEELQEKNFKKGFAEGKAEGKAEGISVLLKSRFSCDISDTENALHLITDINILEDLFLFAIKCHSIEEFNNELFKNI